jgi:myo-inositol-1(or 4)-monophosphatase
VASSPALTIMIAAVRKAARGVQRDFGEIGNLQVSMKGPGDFVTAADKKCEKTLREELSKARPGYGFLGEEEGETKGTDPDHRFTYNPISDELFHSEKGTGAFCNNKRMRVSGRKNLHEALVSTNIPHIGQKNHVQHRNETAVLQARTADLRAFGSTAMELAYVAAGRTDAAWCHNLHAYDMAAGLLFVREAGGFVSKLDGDGDPLYAGNYVATNAELMPAMRQAFADAKKL